MLQSKGIRHLPILKDGRPVGILSSRDFLAYVVEGLERLVQRARYIRDSPMLRRLDTRLPAEPGFLDTVP